MRKGQEAPKSGSGGLETTITNQVTVTQTKHTQVVDTKEEPDQVKEEAIAEEEVMVEEQVTEEAIGQVKEDAAEELKDEVPMPAEQEGEPEMNTTNGKEKTEPVGRLG